MKKNTTLFVVLLFTNLVLSQESLTKNTVVDFQTLKPIANVNIYNQNDNTISNSEGKFSFKSIDQSIVLSHLGYETIETNFNNLRKTDTIFLKSKVYELNEITVTDNKNTIRKVYESINTNYPFKTFTNEYFIRSVLRKNGEIIKLHDMVLNIERNSLFTNQDIKQLDYNIEVLNVRKEGFSPKSKKEEEFKLLSIEELFNWLSAVFTVPNVYNYKEDKMLTENHLKIDFIKSINFNQQKSLDGYYIVNLNDFSLDEVYYKTIFDDISKIPFNIEKSVKWRTIENQLFVSYKKNMDLKKYLLNSGKLKTSVEVINNEKKSIYEVSYEIINVKNNISKKIKPNFSQKKEIFKADFKYDKFFWENQNELPLDTELIDFLKKLNNKGNNNNVYTNFNE